MSTTKYYLLNDLDDAGSSTSLSTIPPADSGRDKPAQSAGHRFHLSSRTLNPIARVRKLIYSFCFLLLITTARADSALIPLRYDLQLQLPTASVADPLIPTFFACLRLDFQLTRPLHSDVYYRDEAVSTGTHGIELAFRAEQLNSFENVTLTNNEKAFGVVETKVAEGMLVFVLAEKELRPGRYSLHVDRYIGLITDEKGVFYRDVGGAPAIGTDLYPNAAHLVVPVVPGVKKASVRLSVIHPRNTVALSNMQQEHESFVVHEHWRMTDFVQAANLALDMFCFLVLPDNYEKYATASKYPISVYVNKDRHSRTLTDEVLGMSGMVYDSVYEMLEEPLPFTQINVAFLNDFNGTHSTGLILLGEEEWEESDECHKIEILARHFIRQWVGGLTTLETMHDFCLQEDIVAFLATKIVAKHMSSHPRTVDKYQKYRLSQLVRIHLIDTFFYPNSSLTFDEFPTAQTIAMKCGGKGAQMFESLETIFGERSILDKIKQMVRHHAYKTYTMMTFLNSLKDSIVDGIDLAQVYEFWFHTSGIPNLRLEQSGERLRLSQFAVDNNPLVLFPLRISIRNLTLPISFMLSQGLELAPLDSKLLPLTNLGFGNVYRVNYNAKVWERILRHLEEAPHMFSARAKAQLLNDFCYFSAKGQVGPEDGMLRQGFLQLMRSDSEQFDLCELYAFWCVAGCGKLVRLDEAGRSKMMGLWGSVNSVLNNYRNYECATTSDSSALANVLCRLAFGADCL